MSDARRLVDKLWNYCDVLLNAGVSVIEYTEQLTYLLFLKMAHERETRPLNPEKIIPSDCSWQRLLDSDGAMLDKTYREILEKLGQQKGTLGVIFRKAQNKIEDPSMLRKLVVDLIDSENWSATGVDIKGDAYEGLLAKGAGANPKGAGQYFTPRSLIDAIVDVMRPTIKDTIYDPACGTAGFLLGAYQHVIESGTKFSPDERKHLQEHFVRGCELVPQTARLAAMNMILHGIGRPNGDSLIDVGDSLIKDPGNRYSMILANPPFGLNAVTTFVGENGKKIKDDSSIQRDDFWVTTANKQLNFLQHIKTILDINGRAAVVLPDNVLFEGGVGETVRRRLLTEFNVHTLLRLPTGIFYAGGVKANVLFFDKKPAAEKPWTTKLWVYDFRTNQHFTQKTMSMKRLHLDEFVECYKSSNREDRVESQRFKFYTYEELIARDKVNLDLIWLKDDSLEDAANLPAPEVIAREIMENLESALSEFTAIVEALEGGNSK